MYARIITFTLEPGNREVAERLADDVAKFYRGRPGFKSATFMADWGKNEYSTFSVWASREDIESAVAALQPILKEKVGALLKGPPQAVVYEIYEPKA